MRAISRTNKDVKLCHLIKNRGPGSTVNIWAKTCHSLKGHAITTRLFLQFGGRGSQLNLAATDKVVYIPLEALPWRALDVWRPACPLPPSVCTAALYLLPLITFGFLPSITAAVAYYNLEMEFKRERRRVPEWEKHGLAQWKQIKWACQTSRFVRNKKRSPFYIRCLEYRTNRIVGGFFFKATPVWRRKNEYFSWWIVTSSESFPSGVTRVSNAVRGQACLFIAAAGLCVLREAHSQACKHPAT